MFYFWDKNETGRFKVWFMISYLLNSLFPSEVRPDLNKRQQDSELHLVLSCRFYLFKQNRFVLFSFWRKWFRSKSLCGRCAGRFYSSVCSDNHDTIITERDLSWTSTVSTPCCWSSWDFPTVPICPFVHILVDDGGLVETKCAGVSACLAQSVSLCLPACIQMMMTDTGSSVYWGSEGDLDESVWLHTHQYAHRPVSPPAHVRTMSATLLQQHSGAMVTTIIRWL